MRPIIISLLLCVGLLSACATTSAPEVAQFQGQNLKISAKATPGLFNGELQLFINDELVITQRSQAFGGSSQSFEGSWQGRNVTARATRVQNFISSYTQVDVFIQGRLVETLVV